MYEIIKSVIESKNYELGDMLKKIDVLWLQGGLNDEQKAELTLLSQNGADSLKSIDVVSKLLELDAKIKALEEKMADGQGESEEKIAEYTAGKWYRKGEKVVFEEKTYICTAPDGVVCVWSPSEYPAYWTDKKDA